jgi:hypothetical protein
MEDIGLETARSAAGFETALRGAEPARGGSVDSSVVRFTVFLAVALAFRAPTLLYSELNWDEHLYRLIADSLLRGHVPYTEIWDRKPVGIFVIIAALQAAFGSSILALRIATSVAVAAAAILLTTVGRRLFPRSPTIGVIAGFFFIFYTMRNGGEGANTELFFIPLHLMGLCLLLQTCEMRGSRMLTVAFAAGLFMGAAVQVKYNVVFDIVAFAATFLLLNIESISNLDMSRLAGVAATTGLGILVPTATVIAWYALIGHLNDFIGANFSANATLVGATAPGFDLANLRQGLRNYDLLVLGAIAALVGGRFLARDSGEKRGWLAVTAWLGAMALALLFLRRFADHFFIQTLPSLSLAAAFFVARSVAVLTPSGIPGLIRLLLPVGCVAVWGGYTPFDAAMETLSKRYLDGIPHWGDRSATVAAALRERLQPADEIYVVGRTLGVYYLTERRSPTRFAFAEHLWMGYAPVDGAAELERILERRPTFIVLDDLWLPGVLPPQTARDRVLGILHEILARDYVLDQRVGRFESCGGGFVGGGIGVSVFRLRPDADRSAQGDIRQALVQRDACTP